MGSPVLDNIERYFTTTRRAGHTEFLAKSVAYRLAERETNVVVWVARTDHVSEIKQQIFEQLMRTVCLVGHDRPGTGAEAEQLAREWIGRNLRFASAHGSPHQHMGWRPFPAIVDNGVMLEVCAAWHEDIAGFQKRIRAMSGEMDAIQIDNRNLHADLQKQRGFTHHFEMERNLFKARAEELVAERDALALEVELLRARLDEEGLVP